LDAIKFQAKRPGQRIRQCRFPHARQIFD
jgi:hypothetical protein